MPLLLILGRATTTGMRLLIAGLFLLAVFAATGFRLEWLTYRKAAGLVLGISGVALVSSLGPVSYSPWALAGGSQLVAEALFLPLILAPPPRGELTLQVGAVTAAFAVLCSAVAYLLYYRLVADVGATRALTVTLLMPAFGMLWGFLFLGERITWMMILGVLVILAGTFLVVFPPRNLRRGPEAALP
jgi:drug/metabolite transporter (DMT)-like permease